MYQEPRQYRFWSPAPRSGTIGSTHYATSALFLVFLVLNAVSVSAGIRVPLQHVYDTGPSDERELRQSRKEDVDSPQDRSRREAGGASAADDPSLFSRLALRGKPGLGYYISMTFGTPPQYLNVLVDTGSSNLAIACASDHFVDRFFDKEKSRTWQSTGKHVQVPYTQGKWEGPLITDVIGVVAADQIQPKDLDLSQFRDAHTLGQSRGTNPSSGSNPSTDRDANFITETHTQQSPEAGVSTRANLACIENSSNFFINGSKWQGILGLGYDVIARPSPDVTPYFDTLTKDSFLTRNLFALQLCGTVDRWNRLDVSMGGMLDLGDLDRSAYKGDIFYTPIRKQWYYDVVLTDVDVSGASVGVNSSCAEFNTDKTIVDSGTTNLRLPEAVFKRVVKAIQNHTKLSSPAVPDDFWQGHEIMCWKRGATPWQRFPEVGLWLVHQPQASDTQPAAEEADADADADVGGSHFRLVVSPQQYLRAVDSKSYERNNVAEDCYKFAITSSETGSVLGAVVMEGFYVVFDREKHQIGFALSTCPLRDPTRQRGPAIEGPHPFRRPRRSAGHAPRNATTTSGATSRHSQSDPFLRASSLPPGDARRPSTANGFLECAYKKEEAPTTALIRYAVYGISAMCVVIAALLVMLLFQFRCRKCQPVSLSDAPRTAAPRNDEGLEARAWTGTVTRGVGTVSRGSGTVSRGIGLFGGAAWRPSAQTSGWDDRNVLVDHEAEFAGVGAGGATRDDEHGAGQGQQQQQPQPQHQASEAGVSLPS